jgi:predicted acyl esterase
VSRLRPPSRSVIAVAALLAVGATALPATAKGGGDNDRVRLTSTSAAPLRSFETVPLKFTVEVGPQDDRRTCSIVGDLRVPEGVSADSPAPGSVLATNGFGGSKDGGGPNGNGAYGARFAEQGYVTLSYSGLGFGGSSCLIYVDDPQYDGQAASQLVSFLGGAEGIAVHRETGEPYSIPDLVRLDAVAHDGTAQPNDPRVGMIGGSYGGQIQFAVASIDPRVDALAPVYTWHDLGYSLAPNNAGQATDTGVTSATPGIWKSAWHSLFFGLGVAGPVIYRGNSGDGCGGYVPWVCQAYAENSTVGVPSQATLDRVADVSVGSYIDKIRIPVLLSQGQKDSLFNLNEAVATFTALQEQGTPARMVWQSWGHTSGDPVPGELDAGTTTPGTGNLLGTVQGRIFTDWMAHWLKDEPTDLGPAVRYFRDYAYEPPEDPGDAEAAFRAVDKAYAGAGRYPVGRATPLYLSGGSTLVDDADDVRAGSATFAATGTVPPTNTGEAVRGGGLPQHDAPGTSVRWTSAPLDTPLDVAGIPEVTVRLDAPAAAGEDASPLGKVQMFAKLYDVAPDGSRTLVRNLVSAVRVPDADEPVRIMLQGIVHRFDEGHSVQLVLAASDATYKGLGVPGPVTITDDPSAPNVLSLPVVGRGQAGHGSAAKAASR